MLPTTSTSIILVVDRRVPHPFAAPPQRVGWFLPNQPDWHTKRLWDFLPLPVLRYNLPSHRFGKALVNLSKGMMSWSSDFFTVGDYWGRVATILAPT